MSSSDSKEQEKSETVLPIKKKRQFTWTEKRTAQFEKMKKMNVERKKEKKEKGKGEKEKPKLESEEEKKEVEEGEEVEDKQSKRIMKRVMDTHFLARKDRHTVGTTSEPSSESSESENESSESEEESDSSEEIKSSKRKKGKKRSYSATPKRFNLQKQIESLRAKNKQLQSLFVTTKIKKSRKKYESEGSEDEYQEEEEEYERPSKRSVDKVPIERPTAPYFFC